MATQRLEDEALGPETRDMLLRELGPAARRLVASKQCAPVSWRVLPQGTAGSLHL
jgi:hypothetical protein